MIDLIIKTPKEFYEAKDSIKVSECLTEKYLKIFQNYECFLPHCKVASTSQCKSVPFKTISSKKKTGGFHEVHEKSFSGNKPIEKTILGILNVVNASNYAKNLNKIRFNSSEKTIEVIISEILHKCCLQIFYVNIFIKLIKDMISLSGYSDIIKTKIKMFVGTFSQNEDELILKKPTTVEKHTEYDIFCLEQKFKNYSIAKNTLINYLHAERLILDFDINEYFNNFCSKVEYTSSDIIVQILIQIIKINSKDIQIELKQSLKDSLLKMHNNVINMKLNFLIQELINML